MKISKIIEIILLMLILSCTKTNENTKRTVAVSILPQKFLVEKIAGDNFIVKVMIPPGASPATYEPLPADMMEVSRSEAYFRIGYIGFERSRMNSLISVNGKMKIYDCSEEVDLIKGDHDHHGDEVEAENHNEEHIDENGINPHIWLSPKAVRIIADNILKGLVEIDPLNKDSYIENHKTLVNDIEKLDQQIKTMLKDITNRKFIVYHPAWSYFARDYDLIQIPIEIDGKEPSPMALKELIDTASSEDIKIIVVQKQFDKKMAETISKNINGKVIQLDPLEEKWFSNMIEISRTFQFELK